MGNQSRHERNIITVSQLNQRARALLEGQFQVVWVEGELSNFKPYSSGHWYFTLKDAGAQIQGVMFRSNNMLVRFRPKDGDHVLLKARISLYEARGTYQLVADTMEAAGDGRLRQAFEQLKLRLASEGLFEPACKQPLPAHPRHIGIITSPTGAAIQDMLTVLRRRSPGIQISLLPVAVQGQHAAAEIAAAIDRANRLNEQLDPPMEALIVGRGGGSLEDLWAFNEEIVARAIHASTLPVVSAVGHEIDYTIADFVADVRAPTPSAAAELLSPDQSGVRLQLSRLAHRLDRVMARQILEHRRHIEQLRGRLKHPGRYLQEKSQRLDELEARLRRGMIQGLQQRQKLLQTRELALLQHNPVHQLEQQKLRLAHTQGRLLPALQSLLQRKQQHLASTSQLLHSISPLPTLARGYSITTLADGRLLSDAQLAKPGMALRTRLAQGEVWSQVIETKP